MNDERVAFYRDVAAQAAAERASERMSPCVFRGPTIRTEKKPCCGEVELFLCARNMTRKWHTKCAKCDDYLGTNRTKEHEGSHAPVGARNP